MISAHLYNLVQNPTVQSLSIMQLRATTLFIKFALTLFIARYLGLEDLGLFGLITAVTITAPSFLGLGLMQTQIRHAVTATPDEITAGIRRYALLMSVWYCIFFILAGLAGIILEQPVLAMLIWAIVCFEHINMDSYGLLLNLSRPFVANILHFLRAALWALLFMMLALFFPALQTIEAVLTFWLVGAMMATMGFIIVVRHWPWRIKKDKQNSILYWFIGEFKKSKTLYLNDLACSVGTYADRYIVTLLLGLEMAGIYVFFWQIYSALCNLLRTGVVQVSRPKLVLAHKQNDPAYMSYVMQCTGRTAALALITAFLGATGIYILLPWLKQAELLTWYPLIVPIMFAYIIFMTGEALGLVFYSQHQDYLTLRISLLMFAASIILNIIFIPLFSLWGAASALLGVALILFMVQAYYVHKAR